MKTVFLTAIGSPSVTAAIEMLHTKGYRVIGCDIYPKEWHVNALELDAGYQVPKANTECEKYVSDLLSICEKESVNYLIPITDTEVDVLCEEAERFLRIGTIVCTSDEATTKICRNKETLPRLLSEIQSFRVIPTYNASTVNKNEITYPCILKPRFGRSSEGKVEIKNSKEFEFAHILKKDYVLQPYIEGNVYTIDVVRDQFGNVQTLVRKELLRTINGLGITVEVLPEHKLNSICVSIAQKCQFIGTVNMEFIENDGEYYFLEVNPRFSGGIIFSCRSGFDVVNKHIDCYDKKALLKLPDIEHAIIAQRYEAKITQNMCKI